MPPHLRLHPRSQGLERLPYSPSDVSTLMTVANANKTWLRLESNSDVALPEMWGKSALLLHIML